MNQFVYMTTTQVAERFQVDSSTVRRWVDHGKLKPAITTPGGHYKFTEESVEALATLSAEKRVAS